MDFIGSGGLASYETPEMASAHYEANLIDFIKELNNQGLVT